MTRGWCRAHYQRWYKTGDPLRIRPGRWDGYIRPTCAIADCDRPAHARGLCTIHFPRKRRHGDPLAGRRLNTTGTLAERFQVYVAVGGPDECWPWTGLRYKMGYGNFTAAGTGKPVYAHRTAYELAVDPIPAGHLIHHKCENRLCVNPAHLEALTPKEHRARHRRTHCKNGHPYDEANTRLGTDGARRCRACAARHQRASSARRSAARANRRLAAERT